MVNNYEKTPEGVIRQVERKDFVYNEEYCFQKQSEQGGPEQEDKLSALRLGLIIGSLNSTITSLLDVGYGTGSFLKLASNVVKKCAGNDLSPSIPLPTKILSVNDVTADYYDVITFFNSLEHMPDVNFLSQLKCKNVVITVPWCHYFSDNWFENWNHRRPDEHLWHFNEESLRRFMLKKGYTCSHYSNAEDIFRGSGLTYPNYLTAIFKKG